MRRKGSPHTLTHALPAIAIWLQKLADDDLPATEDLLRSIKLFPQADEINGYLWATTASIELLEKVGRAQEALKTYQEVMDALADPHNHGCIPHT